MTATKKKEESFSDFYNWYVKFDKRRAYERGLETWFNRVNACHATLREQIGGIRQTYECNIKSSGIANELACRPYIDIIARKLPHYWQTYGLTRNDLLSPTIKGGIKTSKHVLKYAQIIKSPDIKDIEYAIATLGEHWAAAKSEEKLLYVSISTAPKAFCLLGHYGPDNCSCFRFGKQNTGHKFTLGASNNTFVVLVRDKTSRVQEPTNSKNTLARMWGFYNPISNAMNFCNLYVKNIAKEDVLETARQLSAQVLEVEMNQLKFDINRITIGGDKDIFHNNNGRNQANWTFHNSQGYLEYQYL